MRVSPPISGLPSAAAGYRAPMATERTPTTNPTPPHPDLHHRKGLVKRFLGWLTADRRVEAEGRAEAQLRRPPRPAAVERSEEQVKRDYGETPEG